MTRLDDRLLSRDALPMGGIHILGAGLTGMSAAHHLLAAGHRQTTLYEKQKHVGGHATTYVEDGFRFDKTGHLLHLRDPAIGDWVRSMLDGKTVMVQRTSRVFSHGRYTRFPYQANTFGLPPEIAYECLLGYLNARENPERFPEPKNFEEFCLKHYGEGFSKHFMIPYNMRLWGAHPREMSTAWCQRFVPMPKLEDVLAGAVGKNDRELGYNTAFLYPELGIGELPKAMQHSIASVLQLERAPTSIHAGSKTLRFAEANVTYDALISTTPLDTLIALLEDAPDAVRDAAKLLRCNPLYYLDAMLDVPCAPDAIALHWAYVPEEKYPFYRLGCYSNFSAKMAPAGKSCLYIELASRTRPNMDELRPKIVAALQEMRIISKPEQYLGEKLRLIEHAYVLYDHNYERALAVIKPWLKSQNIIAAGRYGDWNYSSMEDALIFGRDAATLASGRG